MKKLAASLTLLAGVGFHGLVSAESTTGNAAAVLLTTIRFTEDQIVDFGVIPNGTGTCEMAAGGALSNHCSGTGTPGQFTVSGTASQAVSISVGSGSTDTNVTYNPLLSSTGTTSDSTTLDGSGNAVIGVIGNLTLAGAAGGARALTYTLTVNYQ